MNFPAYLIASSIQAEKAGQISVDLSSHALGIWPDVNHEKPSSALSGAAPTDNLPIVEPGNAISAVGPVHRYFDDYYNRIHMLPSHIDLGNLISERVFQIEVWNAYFTAQNLAAINPINDTGLLLTAPLDPPTDYAPLESRMHTLEAFTYGPPVVDASFTFDFPSDDPVLSVVGNRVATWPFRPNWKYRVVERLEWLTDVLEAYDGTEQRRQLRGAPRRGFDFQFIAAAGDRQHLDAMLWQWQARLFVLPIFTDPGRLGAAALMDDDTLSLPTTDMAYRVGGFAVLKSSNLQTEAVKVIGVNAGGLTLEDGLRGAWPAGTRVYPAELARLRASQPVTAHTAGVDELAVQFDVELNVNITAVDSAASYRGYPVLEEQPNWRENISAEYRRTLRLLDNRTGVVGVDDQRGRPTVMQDYLWTRYGRPAIATLRAWLHARKGRLIALWVPSFRADITLVAPVVAGQAVMSIQRMEYTRYLQQEIGRRDIVIRLRDGNRIYKRIDAATEIDANTEQLILSSTMGQDVDPADVVMISFMQLSRLESDAVEFAWHSAAALECRHLMRGLADDV